MAERIKILERLSFSKTSTSFALSLWLYYTIKTGRMKLQNGFYVPKRNTEAALSSDTGAYPH